MVNRAFGKPTAKVFPLIADEMVATYPAHPSLGLTRGVARVPVAQPVATIPAPLAVSVGSPTGKKSLENKILQLKTKISKKEKIIKNRLKIYGKNWAENGNGKEILRDYEKLATQLQDLENQLGNYDL